MNGTRIVSRRGMRERNPFSLMMKLRVSRQCSSPHLAYWNGMLEIKTPKPSWNDAELQSARSGRRVTCCLSHVRESKQRHGFRSSNTSPSVPTFIVSPPVNSHTAFLDDFFWRSFPYTQGEATCVFGTRGESSPLSLRSLWCVLKSAPASSSVCQTLVVCERNCQRR